MLDLALVLTLAQQCGPQVAPQTLAAIAWTESRFDPLAIGVNARPRRAYRFSTKADAIGEAERLIAAGGNIDLGLAQINSNNLARLGLSVAEVFDPCRNLAAAASVLRSGFRPASARADHRQAALRIALSRYNTGDADRGFRNGYVAKVERAAVDLGLTRTAATGEEAAPRLAPDAEAGAGAAPSLTSASAFASDQTPAPAPQQPADPASSARLPDLPAPWDIFARSRAAAWMTFSPTPSPIDRSQP